MKKKDLNFLKSEIRKEAKAGVDFIMAGGLVWLGIFAIWMSDYSSYEKSIYTFTIGMVVIPFAFVLSKIFRTNWNIKENQLQPLGLWLNFAQVIYFPLLIFIMMRSPDYFIMAYAIVTGAHLFPYAWLYRANSYAYAAVLISVGALVISLTIPDKALSFIPIFTSLILFLLGIRIFVEVRNTEV